LPLEGLLPFRLLVVEPACFVEIPVVLIVLVCDDEGFVLMKFFSVQSETFIIVIFDSKVVLKTSQNDLHLEAVLIVSVMQ
jgi:hypothetical protein